MHVDVDPPGSPGAGRVVRVFLHDRDVLCLTFSPIFTPLIPSLHTSLSHLYKNFVAPRARTHVR